jgi:outer membrane protein assembly factor BamD
MRLAFRVVAGAAGMAVGVSACRTGLDVRKYPDNAALYAAALHAYEGHHYGSAVAGFTHLTGQLPSRDSLAALSKFYLGMALMGQRNYLEAAGTFNSIFTSFPGDTLVDDAILQTGRAYRKLWPKPDLDPGYGDAALNAFAMLLDSFPASPLREDAVREIGELENMLATKDYENAMMYFRRGLINPAISYFTDLLEKYPDTPRSRDAYVGLVRSYKKLKWADNLAETCAAARQLYRGDALVTQACTGVPGAARAR